MSKLSGILISIFLFVFMRPLALHTEHSFSGILPFPWHVGHTAILAKYPKPLFVVCRTWPEPPQVLQLTIEYPLATPWPWHSEHISRISYSKDRVVPKSFLPTLTST